MPTLPATLTDAAAMVAICESHLTNLTTAKDKNNLEQKGFLIRKLTTADAKKMIEDQENFISLIFKDDSETLGYLTACDITKSGKNFQKKVSQLNQDSNHKTLYYKQIARSNKTELTKGKKIGEKLVLTMIDEARRRGYSNVVCRIVHYPCRNLQSIAFHQKFGFKEVGSIKDTDGIESGIYQLELK